MSAASKSGHFDMRAMSAMLAAILRGLRHLHPRIAAQLSWVPQYAVEGAAQRRQGAIKHGHLNRINQT